MTHGNDGADTVGRGTLQERLLSLTAAAEDLGGGREHRREELVERAEERGIGRPEAEQAYDIASQEGVEPAYGMAVVLEGVSVQLLEGPRPDVDAAEPNEPEWVDQPPSPRQAERERRLRQTFRRLRSKLEEADSVQGAFATFAGEPDLEPYDY